MEALKKEMERKKREREALAGGAAAAASGPKKWMRRGDVEAARERQYREETAREAAEQAARLRVPCLEHHDAARGAVSSDPAAVAAAAAAAAGLKSAAEVAAAEAAEAAAAPALAPREVKRRLRALAQPISLFAESDEERVVRLRAVEAALPKSNEADLELKKGAMITPRMRRLPPLSHHRLPSPSQAKCSTRRSCTTTKAVRSRRASRSSTRERRRTMTWRTAAATAMATTTATTAAAAGRAAACCRRRS